MVNLSVKETLKVLKIHMNVIMWNISGIEEMMKYDDYNPCKYVEIRKQAPVDSSGKTKPRVYQAV